MPRHFYLYSNEGDETIKNFGGSWDLKHKRWILPLEMVEQVCEYLAQSLAQETDIDDKTVSISKRKSRKKKVHRENSFYESSSEDETH